MVGFTKRQTDIIRRAVESRRDEYRPGVFGPCPTCHGSPGTALALIERRNDLVSYKQDKAKEWLTKSKGIRLKRGGGMSGASGSSGAFSEGRTDGRKTDVSATRRRKICN